MSLALVIALAPSAQAGITLYSDLPSWNAAVPGATSITIPEPDPNAFIFFGNGNASVTYGGVTYSQQAALSNGNFFNVGHLFSGVPAVLSSQQQSVGVANILVTFPSAQTGFSTDFGTFGGSAVTFTLSNGDTVTLPSTGSGYSVPDFLGLTDTTPFTSVQITSSDGVMNIGTNRFGAAVPEPASMLLLGIGGLGLAGCGLRRWNRKPVI
jgi:hypothetical protein